MYEASFAVATFASPPSIRSSKDNGESNWRLGSALLQHGIGVTSITGIKSDEGTPEPLTPGSTVQFSSFTFVSSMAQ